MEHRDERVGEGFMDQETYRVWWPLHLRHAHGESLSPDEQERYSSGLAVLDREERLQVDPSPVRAARERIAALEREQTRLRAQTAALDEQIEHLEAAIARW